MKITPQTIKIGLAILGITILESIAMVMGIDGALLGLALVAIAGLGGFEIGHRLKK